MRIETVLYPINLIRRLPGSFSFKNCQLMRVTESFYCRSGRVCETRHGKALVGFRFALPIGVNLRK